MRLDKRESKKSSSGYTWRVTVDYKDEYGITRKKTKSGFKTKQEAQKYGKKLEEEITTTGQPATDLTLKDVWNEWVKLNENRLTKSTFITYNSLFKHLQTIENKPIKELNYTQLQELFNHMELAKSTKKIIKAMLEAVYKHAIRSNYISFEPVRYIDVSGKEHETEEPLSYEDLQKVLDFVTGSTPFRTEGYKTAAWIGYYSGLRIGEILALKWSDIDFEQNTISVSRKINPLTGKEEDFLKTKSSQAVVPLCQPLKNVLMNWFEKNEFDYIICRENGTPLTGNMIRKAYRKASEETGIKFHPHLLRHTFVTNVVRSGADPKTAAQLARHSDTSTTMNIYTQMNQNDLAQAIKRAFPEECSNFAPNSDNYDA